MKHRPLLFLLLATALAVPLVDPRRSSRPFRSAIDVVSMNVTVTDSTEHATSRTSRKKISRFSKTASSRS